MLSFLVSAQINILENWKKNCISQLFEVSEHGWKKKIFSPFLFGHFATHSFTHGINLNFQMAWTKSSMRKSQSRSKSWKFLISEAEHRTTPAEPCFLKGELGFHFSQVSALLGKAQLKAFRQLRHHVKAP